MEVKIPNIDDINKHPELKYKYLEERRDWLKEMREKDRRIVWNKYKRVYNFKNKDKIRANQREWYRKNLKVALIIRDCKECGVEFTSKFRRKLFCCRKCNQKYHYKIKKEKVK